MNLQTLREKLEQGFYINNLEELARICKALALDATYPAPFFVMQHIFSDIARYWEDKPLVVEEAKLVEVEMTKPMMALVDAIEVNASEEQIFHLLNKVVSSYNFLLE